jgi:hypothetical protein
LPRPAAHTMGRVPGFTALSRALLLVVFTVTWAARSEAEPTCGSTTRPWVSITFAAGDWPRGFGEKVLADLRGGLTNRGIDACADASGPSSERPLATVVVASVDKQSVAVSVEVRDAVTAKRVSRDVDLARVPPDGRAFAIALAVDELVWASWAEVALAKTRSQTPHPATPPPPEVVAGVASELPRRDEPSSELVLRFAIEHYLGGQTHLGADFGTLVPLAPRFSLDLGAGFRQGLPVSAPDGRVLSSAIGIGAGLRFALLHSAAADAGLSLGARVAVTQFRGSAGADADQNDFSGLTVYARFGAFTSLRLTGPLHLDAALGAGAPLRALEATDNGHDVTGVSGLELFGELGLGLAL